ncbi:AAA family ATPase [Vibrio cholerae]|uniref:AAA family ATPase n=1 Tax=Vibrio cholerae TaxID=666 RepID=UPI002FE533D6
MKLIYLYVEEYKVLKKRDITLCSHFQVTRNKLNFNIARSKIRDDFFTKGLDIVALFGQNGSGKSTAIELITNILSGNFPDFCEFFAFYEENGVIYYYSNSIDGYNVTSVGLKIIPVFTYDLKMERQNVIYFSHQVEPLSNKVIFKNSDFFTYKDCSNQAKLSRLKNKKFSNEQIRLCFRLLEKYRLGNYGISSVPMIGASYPVQEVMWYLKKISSYLFQIPKDLDVFVEKYFELEESLYNVINSYRHQIYNLAENRAVISSNNLNEIFSSKLFRFISRDMINRSNRYLDLLLMLDLFLDMSRVLYEEYEKGLSSAYDDFIDNSSSYLSCHVELLGSYFLLISKGSRIVDVYTLKELIKNKKLRFYLSDLDKSADAYDIYQISSFIQNTFKNNDEGVFDIDSYESFEYVNEFISRDLRIFKNFELKWNGISSGQYSLLTMYSRLFEHCQNGDDLIIFIDEGESNLHPEWQRIYIKELISFFSNVKDPTQNLQVVITSHSPFVLSDLPSESVNILDERCVGRSFFGANIFEIYNKGFLLERTVGQFSYEKISYAINQIKEHGIDDQSKSIIDMIGDQVVKKIIEDMK